LLLVGIAGTIDPTSCGSMSAVTIDSGPPPARIITPLDVIAELANVAGPDLRSQAAAETSDRPGRDGRCCNRMSGPATFASSAITSSA